MRLLRLNDDAPDGASLVLHPNLTVVSGLHGDTRRRVLDALAALPGGRGVSGLAGISGLIEAHGILFDLDPAVFDLLDLDADLDVVVGRAELEKLEHEPPDEASLALGDPAPSLRGAREAQRNAHATYEALRASLDRLRGSYDHAAAERASLEAQLADLAGAATGAVGAASAHRETKAVSQDAEHAQRGTTALLDSPGPTPEAVAALAAAAARVDRLRTKRDDTLVALDPLGEIDTGPVQTSLTDARRLDRDERVPDPAARQLAGMFAAALQAVEDCDRRLEAAGLGPSAVSRRLDEAQQRFVAAEEAVRPPTIDPNDARELEAAHEALQEAELRLTAARMPGKNIKRRLDETVAVEQQILARMGFATYTSFVMSTTAPSVSPELKIGLERAQVELVEAEAAYAELSATYDSDPERSSLIVSLDDLRRRAHALVGHVDDGDLVKALEELTVVDEAHASDAAQSAERLREALEVVGVDFGDLRLRGDEIADVATVWLADMEEAAEQRHELLSSLHELEDEITAAEHELAQMETSAPSRGSASGAPDAAGVAASGGDGSDLTLHTDNDASDRAEEVERALQEALQLEADLEEQYDAQSALVAAAAGGARGAADRLAVLEAAEQTEASTAGAHDGSQRPGLEHLEWYLLAKLASQRSASYAGAVPLVLDDALGHLPDDELVHLLDRLNLMTDAVQVIYVADDPRVVDWADELGSDRGRSLVLS